MDPQRFRALFEVRADVRPRLGDQPPNPTVIGSLGDGRLVGIALDFAVPDRAEPIGVVTVAANSDPEDHMYNESSRVTEISSGRDMAAGNQTYLAEFAASGTTARIVTRPDAPGTDGKPQWSMTYDGEPVIPFPTETA